MTDIRIFKRVSDVWNTKETTLVCNEIGGKFIRDDEGSYFEGSTKEVTVVTKRYIKDLILQEFFVISEEEGSPSGGSQYMTLKFDDTVFNTVEIKLDKNVVEVEEGFPQWIIVYNSELYEITSWDIRHCSLSLIRHIFKKAWGSYNLQKAGKIDIPMFFSLL